MKFTIALAQIDPVLGSLEKNLETHVVAARRARDSGANMVVFPELSLTGYLIKDMNWDLAVNLSRNSSRLAPLVEAGRTIPILAGGVEEGADFKLYNSAFLFENGNVRIAHRKVYPPTYGMFEEMRYFSRGNTVAALDTSVGRVGVLVCEDLWHISLPYLLSLDGALVIIALVASPTRLGGSSKELQPSKVNGENHRAYARLTSTYVVFCNRVGYEDGINFWGGSSVIAPDGEVIAQANLMETDMIFATIDDAEVRRARRFSRHFLDEDPRLILNELSRIAQPPGRSPVP
jgi:predicted amidohydrolase